MPFHYLLYAQEGVLTLEADGRRWLLPPARAALIASGHAIVVETRSAVLANSALFAPDFVPAPPQTLSVFEATPLMRELLGALRGIDAETALDGDSRALFHALQCVAWRLSQQPSPAVIPVPRSRLVRRAVEETERHLAEPMQFEELAMRLAVTPRTLARRFVDELGMTWGDLRRSVRMSRAIEILSETALPVGEVAFAVGYSSQSAFNAAFRGYVGQSPRAFRADIADGRSGSR